MDEDIGGDNALLSLTGLSQQVNLFDIPVGAQQENEFSPEVPAGAVDVFTVVLEHETTHVFDFVDVEGSPALAARRAQLLADAGTDHRNYLRSMFDDGFFQAAPQEFIASIGNQWFADSQKTLELGLARFDAGIGPPINQALFFAEVVSGGTGRTWMFRNRYGRDNHAPERGTAPQ